MLTTENLKLTFLISFEERNRSERNGLASINRLKRNVAQLHCTKQWQLVNRIKQRGWIKI